MGELDAAASRLLISLACWPCFPQLTKTNYNQPLLAMKTGCWSTKHKMSPQRDNSDMPSEFQLNLNLFVIYIFKSLVFLPQESGAGLFLFPLLKFSFKTQSIATFYLNTLQYSQTCLEKQVSTQDNWANIKLTERWVNVFTRIFFTCQKKVREVCN